MVHPLRTHAKSGRLVMDEPVELPEGTVVELVPADEADHLDEAIVRACTRRSPSPGPSLPEARASLPPRSSGTRVVELFVPRGDKLHAVMADERGVLRSAILGVGFAVGAGPTLVLSGAVCWTT